MQHQNKLTHTKFNMNKIWGCKKGDTFLPHKKNSTFKTMQCNTMAMQNLIYKVTLY